MFMSSNAVIAYLEESVQEASVKSTVKPLAKSLHTVTVLVAMARQIQYYRNAYGNTTEEQALDEVIQALGLSHMADVYGLKAQALKKLIKG